MTSTTTSIQGELWSTDPHAWAEVAEGRMRPLYERVLKRLGPLSGARLLDAGCGSGLFADMAARAGADVTGLDAAQGLVTYARQRRPAAAYIVGDLERLPFAGDRFDVVSALNSVLYAMAPDRALAELARVTVPGGRAIVTVGVGRDQAESAALINPLARRDEVPDATTLDLTDTRAAHAALLDAGFASVDTADIAFDITFADEDDAVAAQLPAGPVAAAVRHSGRAAVEAALRSFLVARRRADGTVCLPVAFRCHVAQRAR